MVDYRIKNKVGAFRLVEQCNTVQQIFIAINKLKADITSLHFDYRERKKRLAATDLNHANVQIKADLTDIRDCIKHRSEQLAKLKKLVKLLQRGVQYSLINTAESERYPYAKIDRTTYKAGAFIAKTGDFEFKYGGSKKHTRKKHSLTKSE